MHPAELAQPTCPSGGRVDPLRSGRLDRPCSRRELLQIVDLLALARDTVLIVGRPEPLTGPDARSLPEGEERDAALAHLRSAMEEQGRRRWQDSPVWLWALDTAGEPSV